MQVYDVLDQAVAEPPPLRRSVDDIVAAGQRRLRRKRVMQSTAGGLTVLALIAAVSLPGALRTADAGREAAGGPPQTVDAGRQQPAAAPAAPLTVAAQPFTFTFGVSVAGRFHVRNPTTVSTAYQMARVYKDSDSGSGSWLWAYLTVYVPGAFNPGGIAGAEQLVVAGRPAIQKVGPGASDSIVRRLFAWEYAAGAWAVLTTNAKDAADPSATDLHALVTGLRPITHVRAKLPFRMTYVPAGYKPVELGSGAMAGLDGIASEGEGDYGGATFAKPAPAPTGLTEPFGASSDDGIPNSFEIFVVPNRNSNQRLGDGVKPPARPTCGNGFCNSWSADGKVVVQVASGGRLSDAEMTRILDGITVANVTDPASWPDASTALP